MGAHALLIGFTRFSDSRLGGLNAPRKDVEALKEVLADRARGGFEVTTSIDEDLIKVRRKLSALLDNRVPSDMVLLYYSGHGVVNNHQALFLATSDTNFDSPRADSLTASEIREMMDHSRAQKLIVLLDCCHSGRFTKDAKSGDRPVNLGEFDVGAGAEGQYVLTATNSIQVALDSPNSLDGLSHFTSWLVEGIGRGDASPYEPAITLDALYKYVCRRAKESGAPMTPQRYVKSGTGAMIIARNPSAIPRKIPEDIAQKLDSNDAVDRFAAVEELKKVTSTYPELRFHARKLLRDRLDQETDADVLYAMSASLGLPPSDGGLTTEAGQDMTAGPSTEGDLKVGFWETRVLRQTRIDIRKLSASARRTELPRVGRAWRNSTLAILLAAISGMAILVFARLASANPAWTVFVFACAVSLGIAGLLLPMHESNLLNSRVFIDTFHGVDFDRRLYRRACSSLIGACIFATSANVYYHDDRRSNDREMKGLGANATVPAASSASAISPAMVGNVPQASSSEVAAASESTKASSTSIIVFEEVTCKSIGFGKFSISAAGLVEGPKDGLYVLQAKVIRDGGKEQLFSPSCRLWPTATPKEDPYHSAYSCVRRPREINETSWRISGEVSGGDSEPAYLYVSLVRPEVGGDFYHQVRALKCIN